MSTTGCLLQPSVGYHVISKSAVCLIETCLVYSPRQPGDFAAILFAGGLYSYMPISGYHDILSAISSHGFVVIGVEMFQYPNVSMQPLRRVAEDATKLEDPDKFFEELDWVRC